MHGTLLRISRYAWASPCSAVGLLLAIPMLAAGGSTRLTSGVLEITLYRSERKQRISFSAITFGHVVLVRDAKTLDTLRAHEFEHVKQYERWGLLFFLAYPASSFWQLLKGRNPYWFNYFEVQARERCSKQQPLSSSDDFF